MPDPQISPEPLFDVVVNLEGQYSLWPAHRLLPAGWIQEGKQGSRDECLEHIKVVWTDMRPLSLRRQMEGSNSK